MKFLRAQIHSSWLSVPKKDRPSLVVLGAGWGGYAFAKHINRELYNVTLISPRNHFLFTPLLASTTTGTLEFRCITEPIRHLKHISYHQSRCLQINDDKNELILRDSFDINNIYKLNYDYLIYAVGSQSNDFGIPGVRKNALFLKQVRDAMKIRDKIQELFERASKPTID